ncbi:heterokaryon incompatibility protein-domain-containing protein, partial [Tricladium varicosporioides]
TSRSNIEERQNQGFDIGILPQTFQDAVNVTRKLGKQYLWVDSLCIIQYDDNFEDWKKESSRMEAVFRNAYCTIAATAAEDSTKGFLKRSPVRGSRVQCIEVQTPSNGPAYISLIADDFQRDVEDAILNQRAWVLQERALSRRTIHFTAKQTYWECGYGVRCETLTCMRNSQALFLGDPDFPKSLGLRPAQDKVKLFQYLFTRYSQLGLTQHTDKPLAIAGLEKRLAESFETECKYGIFEKFLPRSLLWLRAGSMRMNRILYGNDRKVPSWSWMAYDGEIQYLEVESSEVEWNEGVKL